MKPKVPWEFKPLYKKNQLILGQTFSPVGIVTLWTLSHRVAQALDQSQYAAIGQLYSATRGLDPLVRNLLANPQIRYLFVYGQDLSHSGLVLQDLFKHGVEVYTTKQGIKCWRVKSSHGEGLIDEEVSEAAINLLRDNVELVVCHSLAELGQRLTHIPSPSKLGPYTEPLVFPKREIEIDLWPAEDAGFIVRGKTVAQVWLMILDTILKFGRVSSTHYDSRQREVLDLVSVVEQEDPDKLYLPEYLPCDAKHLECYFPRVLTNKEYPDCSYTYGQRLRSYFGVDQIQAIISRLVAEPEARSAVASLWDPIRDSQVASGSPCINHLWARLVEGKLYLTVLIRSNDMFSGWPENAFALRKLQALICDEVAARLNWSIRLGDLVIISQSAHIYEDCWEAAQEIVDKYYGREIKPQKRDPRGHFVIEVAKGQIVVEHITPTGEHLRYYKGKSAAELQRILARQNIISSSAHALYLGGELQKAELALKHPDRFSYVQDRPLKNRDSSINSDQ